MKRSRMVAFLSEFLEDAHPDRYNHADGDVTLQTEADLILEHLESAGMRPPEFVIPGKVYYGGGGERNWEDE